MKKIYCLIAITGFLMVCMSQFALCQDLDGKWFKMTFSGKGSSLENDNAVGAKKASGKVVNYIQFVYNTAWSTACPGQFYPFYEIHVWYNLGMGWDYDVWQGKSDIGYYPSDNTFGFYGSPYRSKTFLDKQFVWWAGYWNWLPLQDRTAWADAAIVIDIKRKDGSITTATLNGINCVAEFDATDGSYAMGSCTLKGKLIQPEDLPEGLPQTGAGPLFTDVDPCSPIQ